MRLRVNIDSNNDAMNMNEVKRVLRVLADRLSVHNDCRPAEGKFLDKNGNNIGFFEYHPLDIVSEWQD